ncbi:MAG: NADH-quinone oxidoreductase chain [Proteobacteria bacterium]|nr:NADH-quinone oxidoreductase chain [Pseudomonadota bacterium]
MISEQTLQRIDKLAERYPKGASALLPALDIVQRENGNLLSKEDENQVAARLKVSKSKARGVATYYTMINKTAVGKYHLQVDTCVPGMLMGADEIMAHLKKTLGIGCGETTADGLFTLSHVEDLGSCGTCPMIQVNDTYYESMNIAKVDALVASLKKGEMPATEPVYHVGGERTVLMKHRLTANSTALSTYQADDGYTALAKALAMPAADVIDEVKRAILRGRGGAGFPAGTKWGFLPKGDPRPVYLICNADEGEPGTFKDRQIMEYDPHLLVEGMGIAAHAIGAKKAFIYIRGEFKWIAEILAKAIDEAKAANLLPHVDIVVHRGGGSYVCGDETALMQSLEGGRGTPRLKPPFPANKGLYGCPTIVNNVETLASLPFVIGKGADAFRAMGGPGGYGPKIFGVSGQVNKPGVYEFPLGTPLMTILEAAGGVKGTLKGVIVGGMSVAILKPDEAATLKMDYDACAAAGTALGSGGIMVVNDTVSIPELALRTIKFYSHESCGQCTPCRDGSMAIVRLIEKLLEGKGKSADIDRIIALTNTIAGLTVCPVGEAFSVPIRAMVSKYRDEFEALVQK